MLQCLQKGGSDFDEYEKYVSNVRNKLIFHYDPGEICQALGQIVSATDRSHGQVIIGKDDGYSRFILADTIMLRELCTVIWEAEGTTPEDRDKALNKALDWTNERILAFHDFGTELCTIWFANFQPEE